MNLLADVYYQKNYAALYTNDTHELFDFEYTEGEKIFKNLAIKRPIKEGHFDLETPYGYGGYYTNLVDQSFLDRALAAYQNRCLKENILAEFIRFHPFNDFPVLHGKYFDFCTLDRQVVVINLQQSIEQRWSQYGATTRNVLRKCDEQLTLENSNDIKTFMSLYEATMQRNQAANFYFFNETYYQNLLNLPGVQLSAVRFQGQIIAMGFFMIGPEIAHYHLSANDEQSLKLNANYFMLNAMFDRAIALGCNYFMLGGGRTNQSDDSLLRFKQKFSEQRKDFYIAGKVFHPEKYAQYVKMWEMEHPGDTRKYFLKYRLS